MKTQQNFSIAAGDDRIIELDIDPDEGSMVGTDVTFRVYAQDAAVAVGDAILVKDLDSGLQFSDPVYGLVEITFFEADTIDLAPGNYYFEITTYDPEGNRDTVTEGIMTVLRSKNPQELT